MSKAPTELDAQSLPLPKDWSASVRNAVLNAVGIVRIAMLVGREALIQQGDVKDARIHQLESDLAATREELRIKDARTRRIDPHRRPQYTQLERMAILELRAMRGWSKAETARRFFVSDDTIRTRLRRADDNSLVPLRAVRSFRRLFHLIAEDQVAFRDVFNAPAAWSGPGISRTSIHAESPWATLPR